MALKLEIREHQIKNANNVNVVIECNTNVATYVTGNVLDNNWHDISNDIGNLNQLELEWSRKTENIGQEKGTSFQIQIIGASYTKIFNTLFNTPCGVLNSFDVRITDLLCGVVFNLFEIKADNIEYCEGDGCILTLRLREQNLQQLCFSRTYIYDDWQKWFNSDATSTKQHPYFMVCVDYGKKAFQLGIDLLFLRGWQIARKRLGMDNYTAAPYIRDIILNATMKCGLQLETIFDAGLEAANDCLLWNYNGVYQKNNTTYNSPTNAFDYNTRGGNLILLPEFLDWICELYNAEWFIRNGKLTIRYATDVLNQNSFLDLSSIDNELIESICYSYDLTKKNHTKAYEYQIDPSDKASQQINYLYNDIVNFDPDNNNQMLEGEQTKQFKFASTGFVRDETRDDYIEEAISSAYDFSLALSFIFPIGMLFQPFRQAVYRRWQRKLIYDETFQFTGCVRLEGDGSMAMPRIIRKTPQSDIFEPRVIQTSVNAIQPYPYYNKGLKPYSILNDITKNVWNYPLYFESKFKGNLFDLHHELIDNPLFVNFGNKKITVKLALCCEFLKKLGLPIDDSIKLLETIDVNANNSMVLDEIKVNYKTMLIELIGRQIIKNNILGDRQICRGYSKLFNPRDELSNESLFGSAYYIFYLEYNGQVLINSKTSIGTTTPGVTYRDDGLGLGFNKVIDLINANPKIQSTGVKFLTTAIEADGSNNPFSYAISYPKYNNTNLKVSFGGTLSGGGGVYPYWSILIQGNNMYDVLGDGFNVNWEPNNMWQGGCS
jgi:hypothetical protein